MKKIGKKTTGSTHDYFISGAELFKILEKQLKIKSMSIGRYGVFVNY